MLSNVNLRPYNWAHEAEEEEEEERSAKGERSPPQTTQTFMSRGELAFLAGELGEGFRLDESDACYDIGDDPWYRTKGAANMRAACDARMKDNTMLMVVAELSTGRRVAAVTALGWAGGAGADAGADDQAALFELTNNVTLRVTQDSVRRCKLTSASPCVESNWFQPP